MMYKIRKMSVGVSIKVKYESGESIDRLELARFSNANLGAFISDAEIRGRWVVAQTAWEVTLSEYLENNLNLQTIVLLLKQCIDLVEDIVKNNFLLIYVDFDLDHVWISNFGALQFLYLPAEEERQNSGFIKFFERVISGIKVSDSLGKDILREIIYKVERMLFFSSRQLRAIIDSAEKEYEEMIVTKQNEEAPVGTSSVGPYIYNLSTVKEDCNMCIFFRFGNPQLLEPKRRDVFTEGVLDVPRRICNMHVFYGCVVDRHCHIVDIFK